jgi:hypothetical protein
MFIVVWVEAWRVPSHVLYVAGRDRSSEQLDQMTQT